MELIKDLSQRLASDGPYRLIIVDSIMALFRVDYSGRGELSERQQKVSLFVLKFHTVIDCVFKIAWPGKASDSARPNLLI